MTILMLLCTLLHMLPAEILNELGTISDIISDLSPELLRGVEHIVFSLLLN